MSAKLVEMARTRSVLGTLLEETKKMVEYLIRTNLKERTGYHDSLLE